MATASKKEPEVVGARGTASAETGDDVPKKAPAVKAADQAEPTPEFDVSGPLVGDVQSVLALGHDPASKNVEAKPRNPGLPWQEPPTQESVAAASKVYKDAPVSDLKEQDKANK